MMARRCLTILVPAAALLAGALLPGGLRGGEPTSAPAASARVPTGAPDGTDGRAVRSRATEDTSGKKLTRLSNGGGWLQTLAALAVVIVLIFAVRMLLKRFAASSSPARRGGAIEVLAQARLASRQQVSLVRLGRRLVLVGSGPAGISPLAEVTDPDEAKELLAAVRSGGSGTFAGIFARYSRHAADGPTGESSQKGHGESSSKGSQETGT